MEKKRRKSSPRTHPWFLMPFVWVWNLFAWMVSLTGRVVAAVLGLTLMGVGVLLTVIIVAAPIGIPLMVFGFLLMLRSIF